jgi:hypothetical protein
VPGDVVEYRGALFQVERTQRFRIRWVKFTPPPQEEVLTGGAAVGALLPFAGACAQAATLLGV